MSAGVRTLRSSSRSPLFRSPRLTSMTDRMTLGVSPGRLLTSRSVRWSPFRPEGTATVLPVTAVRSVESFVAETGGAARRLPATIVDAPPALAAEMARREAMPIAPPDTHVGVLERALVRDGVVETAEGTVISESLINREQGDLPSPRFGVGVVLRLRDRPYVLLKQRWDANYGHWLIEGLPRLALIEERFNLADLGFIVSGHHGAMQEVYEASLALFGIRRDQIVEVGMEPIAVDRLIYPTPMTRHAWHIAPRCLTLLEQLAARIRADPGGRNRLYVTRNRVARRRLLNEDEILPIVRRHGFTVVEPQTLSLYRQISLFRNAELVVGNYGAALTNIAFASGRPTLFALTSPLMQDDFFSTLTSLKQSRYLSLHGEASEPAPDMNADFRIDVPRFLALLEALI